MLHKGHADGFLLPFNDLLLLLIARQLRAFHTGGNLVGWNAGVHGSRFNRLDHALHRQRHRVGAVAELEGRLANLLQDGLGAVDGVGARIEERFDDVMQIGVAHIAHANLAVDRGHNHHVVGAVDARIDGARREHRLNENDEPAAVIRSCRHFEIEIGVDDHLRERIVYLVGHFIVGMVNDKPDAVQVDRIREIFQVRHNAGHLGCVGRHLGQVGCCFEIGRRREVERERDVLRDVQIRSRHPVLRDEKTNSIALGARIFAGGHGFVDLRTYLLAHRCAGIETRVVAAHVQGGRHDENRLRAGERDGGAGWIDQRRRSLPRIGRCRRTLVSLRIAAGRL